MIYRHNIICIVKVMIIIVVIAKKLNEEFNSVFVFFSLSEVGRLDTPKLGGNYDTGQLFLHKVSKKENQRQRLLWLLELPIDLSIFSKIYSFPLKFIYFWPNIMYFPLKFIYFSLKIIYISLKNYLFSSKMYLFSPKIDLFSPKIDLFSPKIDLFSPKKYLFSPIQIIISPKI